MTAPTRSIVGLMGFILPAGLVFAWQLGSATGSIDSTVWASPAAVLRNASGAVADGSLISALGASVVRDATGLVFGVPAGLAAGVLLALSRTLDRLFQPSLSAIRQIALFSWVPLISLWLGSDEPGKIAFIAYAVFFPMLLNTYQGVHGADKTLLEVGRVLCLSQGQMLRRIILPASLPGILAGFHLALVYGWLATFGAEYLFSPAPGIATIMMTGRAQYRMDTVIVGMVAIAGTGMAINLLASWVEKPLLRFWNQ